MTEPVPERIYEGNPVIERALAERKASAILEFQRLFTQKGITAEGDVFLMYPLQTFAQWDTEKRGTDQKPARALHGTLFDVGERGILLFRNPVYGLTTDSRLIIVPTADTETTRLNGVFFTPIMDERQALRYLGRGQGQ